MGGVRLVARTPRCGRGNASSILARRRHTFTTLLQHFYNTFMALSWHLPIIRFCFFCHSHVALDINIPSVNSKHHRCPSTFSAFSVLRILIMVKAAHSSS